MNRTRPLRPLTAAAVLAALTPAAASAAPSEVLYDATFKATMTERWQYDERYTDDCHLTGDLCTRTTAGQGSAKVQAHSRRPTRMLVMRGAAGRPPVIGVGTGEGIPLTGSSVRSGSLVTTYGGPWSGANPTQRAATGGCGTKTVRGSVTFAWRSSRALGPLSSELPPDHGDCPDGPNAPFTWTGGESPSFMDAVTTVAPSKFLGTKQFTIHGTRSWTGAVTPISRSDKQGSLSRSGTKTVTWQWEATFRRVRR